MRLLSLAGAGLAALGGLAAAAPPREDPVRALQAWLERLEHVRGGDQGPRMGELEALLDDLRRLRTAEPARAAECNLVLLDTAATGWRPRPEREALRTARLDGFGGPLGMAEDLRERVGLAGDAELEWLLDRGEGTGVAQWLALDVLAVPRVHSLARLRAAADLLAGRFAPATQSALFATAQSDDELLREAAFRALAGWNDPAVHRFFLQQLERGRVPLATALAHLEPVKGQLEAESLELIRARCAKLLASEDWRDAVRAVRLAGVLDAQRAVPLFIESLSLWQTRRARGQGNLRVMDSIVRSLQKLSGRSIGPYPERWGTWWKGVQAGRIELEPDEPQANAATASTFFGLRIASDRVLFVIDRSGSMAQGFATSERSRYEEAAEELLAFATRLGPEARFGVTLFHSGAERWRGGLVPADEAGVKAARRWLESERPDGGTQLFAGLARALDLGPGGRLDPARVEADTVVVLCDGDTAEGPGWVLPWLARWNLDAELVFHCVQIGGLGDGALELLARGTGGSFVRVDG